LPFLSSDPDDRLPSRDRPSSGCRSGIDSLMPRLEPKRAGNQSRKPHRGAFEPGRDRMIAPVTDARKKQIFPLTISPG
jgi:hypothetical protein